MAGVSDDITTELKGAAMGAALVLAVESAGGLRKDDEEGDAEAAG